MDIPFEALIDPGRPSLSQRVPSSPRRVGIRPDAAIAACPVYRAAGDRKTTGQTQIQGRNRHAGIDGVRLLALGNPLPSAVPLPERGSAQVIHLAAHAGLNDRDPLSSFVSWGGALGRGSIVVGS